MPNISIVLIDAHVAVRRAIAYMLDGESDFVIVGEATEGREGMELAERVQPDVLLLEIALTGLSGLEVARTVKLKHPAIQALFFSMHADEKYILQALRNGASGYVLKSDSAETLIEAIRAVAEGRRYLCPSFSERAIDAYLEKGEAAYPEPADVLTARERETLQALAEGMSAKEVAGKLFISPRTVEIHRANIRQKLGLQTQTDLIRYALQNDILTMEPKREAIDG